MENEQEQVAETVIEASEIVGLALENENLQRSLKTRDEKIINLEKSLAAKDGEITLVKKSVEEAKQVIVETSVDLSQAVAAYRALAGQANPGLMAEIIKGDTVTEINASIKSAKALLEKVRQQVGAETARVRVPAGAPPRTLQDSSVLTAREKIKFAVEGR